MLGQIANPQIADISGALDARQARLDRDEKRRREIRTAQLVAEAIPGLREGSPLKELAKNDVQTFAFLAKTLGVPLNSGDVIQSISDDVHSISKIAATDPQGAIQYADTLRKQRQQIGMETKKLDEWITLAQQDEGKAIRAMQVMDKSLNADLYRTQELEQRKMALQERGLDIQEKQLDQGKRPFAGQVVNTSEGLAVFDPTTNSFSRATIDGKPLTGAAYDPELKRQINEAGATGTAVGKDTATAITSVSQVSDNAKFLRDKVNAVLTHPGRDVATGASSLLPVVPGTKQADFVNRFEQLQGDAFLQAFESLKGGGQITEIEGNKAQQAINRMNRGTTKAEFDAAAKDFLSVVDALEQRTKNKAGVTQDQKKTGGVEMIDANGNRAIVYPDGSYEEL